MSRDSRSRHLLVSTSLLGLLIVSPAHGQTATQAPAEQTSTTDENSEPPQADTQEIIVTGFRGSLNSALNLKRQETAAVDSIVSEDIGKFPDSNLAESMQRIPGVALSRGDGGEGRNISVRGLGAQFTRVRINGMEGTSQVSGSDIRGGVATGRSFDFVTFPTEIFSALSVRKTTSADVEEGSLGATVDLRAPRPFDQKEEFVFSGTARGIYNDISKKADPRVSALVSKQFGDTFGVLASLAYSKRHIDEYAYSAVDILPSYVAGQSQGGTIFPYCTPVGYTYGGVPVNSPAPGYANGGTPVGADANNCSAGNPRTSTKEAYDYIMSRTGVSGRPGGGVFLPRLPRPVKGSQNQERMAGSLTLQWKPTDNTDISLDGLYSRFKVNRLDTMLDARSMGRTASNNGQPMMSIRDIEVDDNGSLIHGLWDGVDLRSEMQDVMVYGHANGADIAETVDAVGHYIDLGYKAIRAQSGVPGIKDAYGVGRGKLFYEPADAALPSLTIWDTKKYLDHIPKLFEKIRGTYGFEHHLLHDGHHRMTPIEAAQLGKALEPAKLFWLEDATPAENQEAFKLIRQHTTTPLAVGEIFNTIWDCKELIQNQLIDYIRATVVHAGGITHLRRIADLAAIYQIKTGSHGATDLSPVCMGAALHFDTWVPNFGIQEYMRHTPETDEVFPHSYRFEQGYMYAGDAPGHGVDIDEKLAAKYPYQPAYLPVARLEDGTMFNW